MATTIKLKLRKRTDMLTVPAQLIVEFMKFPEETAKERLFRFFEPLQNGNVKTHDKEFLETTINWVPVDEQSGRAKGLPMTEQVRWIKLAQKVNEIDDKEEGELVLSNKDIDLIWERWNDRTFKINALPQSVIEFLMEFQETTNRWFPDLEPETGKIEE